MYVSVCSSVFFYIHVQKIVYSCYAILSAEQLVAWHPCCNYLHKLIHCSCLRCCKKTLSQLYSNAPPPSPHWFAMQNY